MKAVPIAERAALGALLLQSTRHSDVPSTPTLEIARWLRAEDFADPWHREVYTSLRALAAAGDPAGGEAVGQHMLRRLGPTRAEVVRIADLLHHVPTGAHAGAYALMVLEAALRREAVAQGVVLRAGALQSALEGSPRPMTAVTGYVDSALDAAAHRWTAATDRKLGGPGRPHTEQEPRQISAARINARLSADRLLAAHPAPVALEVAQHEATLIAALLNRPGDLHPVAVWLRPAALTNRTWRPVYEAMLNLHTYGRPVDAVTVLWETQRGSRASGPGPDPATVTARVEAAFGTSPAHAARIVAADHLRLTADRAADSLVKAAANPGLDLGEVLGTGHILTEALRAAARPITGPPGDANRLATVHAMPPPHAHRAGPVAG